MVLQKWMISFFITLSFLFGQYRALFPLFCFWVMAYPIQELLGLCILGFLERLIFIYLFK